MTDLQALGSWVNPGELFASTKHVHTFGFTERDVYHIRHLGYPSPVNVEFFYRVYSVTQKRLIVSDVENACEWVKYFIRANSEFMEVDGKTFIFDKDL